jgi:uncharacterized membrane protein
MENHFVKISNKVFAIIFSVVFILTLYGIIAKQAWWHIYTLVVTGILAVLFWAGDDNEYDDREDHNPYPEE